MKTFGRIAGITAAMLVILLMGPVAFRSMVPQKRGVADFYQEWSSARSYWLGEPLYQETRELVPRDFGPRATVTKWLLGRNVHPPTAVLLSVPFGKLSYRTAFLVWNLLGMGCAIASIVMLVCGRPPIAWRGLIILPALLLLSPHLINQFIYGQLSLFLLVLLTGAALAWSAGRSGTSGALIGLAAAIKLFPAVLGWLFLVRRDARGLAGVFGGFAAATALTWSVLGTSAFIDYFGDVVPEAMEWRAAATNSSIPGLWSKLFDPGTRGGHIIPLRHNPLLARGLTAACAVLFLALWGRITLRASNSQTRQLAFAAGTVAMLLLSPIAWEHYVILLLPAAVIFWDAARGSLGLRLALTASLLLVNAPLYRLIDASLPELQSEPGAEALHMLGFPSLTLYGLLALFAIGLRLARTAGQPPAVSSDKTAADAIETERNHPKSELQPA